MVSDTKELVLVRGIWRVSMRHFGKEKGIEPFSMVRGEDFV